MDQRIGTLNSGKFYAYANGYQAAPVVGTLAEVEVALGLRKPARKLPREFTCTVRPGVESWNVRTYTTSVWAMDRNEAIRRARAEYEESVGARNNGAATITARLAA